MHSRANHNSFACLNLLGIALESGADQHVTVVAGNRLTERLPAHPHLPLRVCLQLVQVLRQISVRVRIAVREVDHIAVMLKHDAPRQSVVVAGILPLHCILVIADVPTSTDPAFAGLAGFRLAVDERAHSVVVQAIRLHQVNDVEPVKFPSGGV